MNPLETPLFSNSCGKLFSDKILLATSNNESVYQLQNVHNIAFKTRPQIKSLLFLVFPALLFSFPLFIHDAAFFLKAVFFVVGILFAILTLTNLQKNYTLTLYLKDKTSRSITVWEGNRKEAQKFAEKVKAKLARRQG
jgi:hypothetical protein